MILIEKAAYETVRCLRDVNTKENLFWGRVLPLLLALVAVAGYLPGISWGLPQGTSSRTQPWGPDEIAPMGPLHWAHSLLSGTGEGPTKYPLFHYLLVAVFYVPYLLFQLLTGKWVRGTTEYPYGWVDPVASLQTLVLIARAVSVLMGAGTVVVAYFTAKRLWDRTTAVLAGVFVLLLYPMFYYAKMSNVDVPALFWCSLVFLLAADVLQEGWTIKGATWMGVFAALAMATKDQSYAILILLPFGLVLFHLRAERDKGQASFWSLCKAPLVGLLISALVYVFASGLVLRPAAYLQHLRFADNALVGSMPSFWYYRYAADLAGYRGLLVESLRQIVDSLGWLLFLAASAGIVICLFRERSKLVFLLTVPVFLVGVILPVRHTAIRFMLPLAFLLACYSARALAVGCQSPHPALRALAWMVILVGCSFEVLRGADLVHLMRTDPRYTASAWLAGYARPGDHIEFFESPSGKFRGRINKMPCLPKGVEVRDAAETLLLGARQLDGEFLLTVGPEDQELHWFCPPGTYHALLNGSLGYQLGANIQTPSLFSHPHLNHHINPRVQIFVRRDRAEQLGLRPVTAANR